MVGLVLAPRVLQGLELAEETFAMRVPVLVWAAVCVGACGQFRAQITVECMLVVQQVEDLRENTMSRELTKGKAWQGTWGFTRAGARSSRKERDGLLID